MPWTDEQWKKFSQGLNEESGGTGGDVTVHAPSSVPSFDPLNTLWAGVKGAAREGIQEIQSLPFATQIPNEDKKDPVMNFAERTDKEHPYAEQAGRFAADIAPMALIPELDVEGGIANAANATKMLQTYLRHPRMVSGLHHLANWIYKGAVGGAMQAPQDRATGAHVGAEAGVASQALRQAFLAARPYWKYGVAGSVATLPWLAYQAMRERGRLSPYLEWHAAQAIPTVGAAISTLFPPGVAGAAGERAARATGYDRANQPKSPDEQSTDELAPDQ